MLLTSTRAGLGRPWARVGLAIGAVACGTNQFTPLLLMYRSQFGFTVTDVTAALGAYALGLMPALLIAGPLSDRLGRRPVALFGVALSMVASGVLIFAPYGCAWLLAGRVLIGVASGSTFSTGAAWIRELSADPASGARRASLAMTLGFGIGPLVAGGLAQWAPAPAVLPYIPQLVLAAVALRLIARTPETAEQRGSGRLRVHGLAERRFLRVALPMAPWVFISATVAMAYAPGLVRTDLAVAFATVATVSTALSGAAVTPLARRLQGGPRLLVAAFALVIAGLVAEAAFLSRPEPMPIIVAAIVLGAGYAFCLVFGLTEVQRLARPADLAGMTAVFQAVSYLGYVAPYLLSLLGAYASPPTLMLCLAGLAVITFLFTYREVTK